MTRKSGPVFSSTNDLSQVSSQVKANWSTNCKNTCPPGGALRSQKQSMSAGNGSGWFGEERMDWLAEESCDGKRMPLKQTMAFKPLKRKNFQFSAPNPWPIEGHHKAAIRSLRTKFADEGSFSSKLRPKPSLNPEQSLNPSLGAT